MTGTLQSQSIEPKLDRYYNLGLAKIWATAGISTLRIYSQIYPDFARARDIGNTALPFGTVHLTRIWIDSTDYIDYDMTNNRYLFHIGYAVVGYVDSTGFHNGAPP